MTASEGRAHQASRLQSNQEKDKRKQLEDAEKKHGGERKTDEEIHSGPREQTCEPDEHCRSSREEQVGSVEQLNEEQTEHGMFQSDSSDAGAVISRWPLVVLQRAAL